MGMVPAAALVTRYAMTLGASIVLAIGICAGRKEKTNVGDIIIASDVFNYDVVKRQSDGNVADYPHAPLDARLWDVVKRVLDQDGLAFKIEMSWPPQASRPNTRLNILHGPLATGSALVADRAVFREVSEHQRRVLGIDMEAYGVARAVHYLDGVRCLIVKSVADHADGDKADNSNQQAFREYRKYCCHTSATMAKYILDRLLS
jgi:nucleoside phosphorylase